MLSCFFHLCSVFFEKEDAVMVNINKISVSDTITARKVRDGFNVAFPYHKDAVARIKSIRYANFDPISKSWDIPIKDPGRVTSIMTDIHTILCNAGIESPKTLSIRQEFDWSLAPHLKIPEEKPVSEGDILKINSGYVLIEKIGDLEAYGDDGGFTHRLNEGKSFRKAWYRVALDAEVQARFFKSDDPEPEF
jgi:hypothetical protein